MTLRMMREREARLSAELEDARQLHEISTALIGAEGAEGLQDRLIDAAMALLRADCASLQRIDPVTGELVLLASRFAPEAAAYWSRVPRGSASVCAEALRTGGRVLIADVEAAPGLAGTEDLEMFRRCGLRACQSTLLLSRRGRPLGMLSTHWREPHEPDERRTWLLDVLARQAADLIERAEVEQALRERDRRKDEFLATLAHELRNPLAPLRIASHLLRTQALPEEHRHEAKAMIDRQVTTMTRLVDDLLDVSRLTLGRVELRREPVSLAVAIEHAVEATTAAIDAGRHALALEMPREAVWVDADVTRLAQVFTNLLTNAAKYTPPGGSIVVRASATAEDVVVTVRDDGVGIPPAMLGRVFDMFTQVPQREPLAQGGLGIGLALARRLVEMHGGTIEAHSDGEQRGSEFRVRLPRCRSPLPAELAADELVVPAPQPHRILVVDDNVDAAESLALLLQVHGHDVQVAHSGTDCLRALDARVADAVILDIGMPGMDGYEVARRIRSRFGGGPRLVALTGWGQERDRQLAAEAGFDHHLTKPADPTVIASLVVGAGAAH